MNRTYTPEEIAQALTMLERNVGTVALTAMQTAIPQRTFFRWKREENAKNARLWHKNNSQALPQTIPNSPESLYTADEDRLGQSLWNHPPWDREDAQPVKK